MRSTESIYIFFSDKKTHEKGWNRNTLRNNILDFKSWFIYQFKKLNSRLSIFAIYWI